MENEEYNKNHAASIDYVNSAIVQAWSAMKTWVNTNIDTSNQMLTVKGYLDQANRQIIGTTGTEKAQAALASVNAMVAAFEDAGIDMTNVTLAEFSSCIGRLSNNLGCYIEDTDGVRWTPENWAYQKQILGHDPATFAGILLSDADHDIYIASRNYGTMMWGTCSHTVPNMEASAGGSAGTPKSGEFNSRKIMAGTNPNLVRSEHKMTYREGMDTLDFTSDIDIVLFPNETTLTTWAASMGLSKMQAVGEGMIYAFPHADSTEANPLWVLKYCRNGVTSIQFQNREALAPYTDNYGQLGCTALNICYVHKEHANDTSHWRLPSLYEALLQYLNKGAINTCRDAIGQSALPSACVWCCLQNTYNNAYCFSLADGSYNTPSKTIQYWVVPVASELTQSE